MPPTIASIDQDFASAGGGDAVACFGSGLGSVASVFVDSVPAQVIRYSDSQVRFLVPPCGDDPVNGLPQASVVTVSDGRSSASVGLWYIPAYRVPGAAMYSARRVTSVSGVISVALDLSGNGNHAVPMRHGPTLIASPGAGIRGPYWQCAGYSVDNRMIAPAFPGLAVTELAFAGSVDVAPPSSGYIARLGANADASPVLYCPGGTIQVAQYVGAEANPVPVGASADFAITSLFAGTGSQTVLNGVVVASGQNPFTATAVSGLVIGGENRDGSTFNHTGRVRMFACWPAPMTVLGRANLAAYLMS